MTKRLYEDNAGGLHIEDEDILWSELELTGSNALDDMIACCKNETTDWTIDRAVITDEISNDIDKMRLVATLHSEYSHLILQCDRNAMGSLARDYIGC